MNTYKNKIKIALSIILILGFFYLVLGKYQKRADFKTQERVDLILGNSIKYFEWGGNLEELSNNLFAYNNIKSGLDLVKSAYEEAIKLNPHSLHINFGLASILLFKNEVESALKIYDNVLKMHPSSKQAIISKSLLLKALEREEEFNKTLKALKEAEYTSWREKVENVYSIVNSKVNRDETKYLNTQNNIIVVLGSALNSDGSISKTLTERLDNTILLHKAVPKSKIILTGGQAKNGITEALAMKNYLKLKGINEDLLIIEPYARDTIENAALTYNIIKDLKNVNKVILLSSPSHIKRALILFNEYKNLHSIKIDLEGFTFQEPLSEINLIPVFRDVLRINGFWMFPRIKM